MKIYFVLYICNLYYLRDIPRIISLEYSTVKVRIYVHKCIKVLVTIHTYIDNVYISVYNTFVRLFLNIWMLFFYSLVLLMLFVRIKGAIYNLYIRTVNIRLMQLLQISTNNYEDTTLRAIYIFFGSNIYRKVHLKNVCKYIHL